MSAASPGSSVWPPPLPESIWVVAGVSLVAQLIALAERGLRVDDGVSLVGSMVLGAVLVGWVSAGVVRARTVRLVLAWVVLVLAAVMETVELVSSDPSTSWFLTLASLGTTVIALAGLNAFRQTEWYRWHRTRPTERPSIAGLVAVGVLVGVLGGVVGASEDGLRMEIRTAAR